MSLSRLNLTTGFLGPHTFKNACTSILVAFCLSFSVNSTLTNFGLVAGFSPRSFPCPPVFRIINFLFKLTQKLRTSIKFSPETSNLAPHQKFSFIQIISMGLCGYLALNSCILSFADSLETRGMVWNLSMEARTLLNCLSEDSSSTPRKMDSKSALILFSMSVGEGFSYLIYSLSLFICWWRVASFWNIW